MNRFQEYQNQQTQRWTFHHLSDYHPKQHRRASLALRFIDWDWDFPEAQDRKGTESGLNQEPRKRKYSSYQQFISKQLFPDFCFCLWARRSLIGSGLQLAFFEMDRPKFSHNFSVRSNDIYQQYTNNLKQIKWLSSSPPAGMMTMTNQLWPFSPLAPPL